MRWAPFAVEFSAIAETFSPWLKRAFMQVFRAQRLFVCNAFLLTVQYSSTKLTDQPETWRSRNAFSSFNPGLTGSDLTLAIA